MCSFFSRSKKKKAVLYAKELKFPLFCPSSPLVLLRINSPFWTFEIAFRALLVQQKKTKKKKKKKKLIIKREKTIIKKSKT